jgi:hypothetical protein
METLDKNTLHFPLNTATTPIRKVSMIADHEAKRLASVTTFCRGSDTPLLAALSSDEMSMQMALAAASTAAATIAGVM